MGGEKSQKENVNKKPLEVDDDDDDVDVLYSMLHVPCVPVELLNPACVKGPVSGFVYELRTITCSN